METQLISRNESYTTSYCYKIQRLDYRRLEKSYLDRGN